MELLPYPKHRGDVAVSGIPITPFLSMNEAVSHVLPGRGQVRPGFGVAINAEKVIRARRDAALRQVISAATLRFADGMPVVWTLRRKGCMNVRVPGVELWEALMRRAGTERIPVFVLGASPEVNSAVVHRLKGQFDVPVAGRLDGYFTDEGEAVEAVVRSRANLVAVALGSPRQEEFISRCRAAHPGAFYLGVGGSFDVFAGVAKRAPKWLGDSGLEWLYRLVHDPRRITRQAPLFEYMALHLSGRL